MKADTNTIEYYAPYIFTLIVIYVLVNFTFRLLNNSNVKKDDRSFSFDYYGRTENIQVIHDELSPDQALLRSKYFIAVTLIKSSFWVKAPYLYALYSRLHGFDREEIGLLLMTEHITSIFLGPLIGSVADIVGRKKFCVAYPIITIIQLALRLTGDRLFAYFAMVLTGVGSVLIDTSYESWLNFEASLMFEHNEDGARQKNSYLREVFTKQIYIDCLTSILLTGVATFLYVSLNSNSINFIE